MKRGVVTALVVYFASSRAYALDPPFGARGQTVISDDANANVTYTWYESGATFLVAHLAPSVDYFLLRNFALGLDAGVTYQRTHAFDAIGQLVDAEDVITRFGVRVAPNFAFSRWISVWPRATFYFDWVQDRRDPTWWQTTTTSAPELTLYVPLMLHLRTHFFVGFGPAITHRWYVTEGSPTAELTIASMHTMIGGHFGGEKTEAEDDVPIHQRPFGEEHEVVLEGGASFTWQGTPSNTYSSWSGGANVAIGYFVMKHLSATVGIGGAYTRTDTAGLPSTEAGNVYVAPGLGYDVPISSRFSFYPQAWLGFGVNASSAYTTLQIYVTAYAPILLHAAPHFFLGFGPALSRDLVDKDPSYPSANNAGTTVGASLVVGGWL